MKVLCFISTRKRYFTTLPLAIESVIMQTVRPDRLMIYDDNIPEERVDLRENEVYKHLFGLLDVKRIEWQVIFGNGKGQHHGHQLANRGDYPFVWRLDDDEIANPDVLERLLSYMKPDVGAVAGSVITGKGMEVVNGAQKISDIYHKSNIQWRPGNGMVEVEHLYSSFLYRAGIVDYCTDLSPVAHREETIFTHELKRKGYKLLVTRPTITYHLRQEEGGIRSHDNAWFYEHDEKLFSRRMESWGYKLINLNCGLGDHLAFMNVLPKMQEKWKHLIIGACYPYVFNGEKNLTLISNAEAGKVCGDDIYKWMSNQHWKKSLVEAFANFYGVTL